MYGISVASLYQASQIGDLRTQKQPFTRFQCVSKNFQLPFKTLLDTMSVKYEKKTNIRPTLIFEHMEWTLNILNTYTCNFGHNLVKKTYAQLSFFFLRTSAHFFII